MRKRQVEIVLLYEDQAHESFLLGYLLKKGYQDGKIRRARGVGSGKVSVQRHYADNVCGHRSYCAKNQSQTRALVVMIDQDVLEPAQRLS